MQRLLGFRIHPCFVASIAFAAIAASPLLGCSGAADAAADRSPDEAADASPDGSPDPSPDASSDTSPDRSGDAQLDAPVDASVHYATKVISHIIGEGGGAGEDRLPDVVLGAPHGAGCCSGSTDTLSLGDGGEIVLGFDVAIVDRPGVDFIVFENAFEIAGDPTHVLAELGEVSVSDDGVTWTTFPCTAKAYPFGSCAGWHPVYASAADPVDPTDPTRAGGDDFDLADLGVTHARFVRIRDAHSDVPPGPKTAGFDLDAVAVLHGAVE